MQVAATSVLWGCGTAIGEVPPYAVSYHAAKAGIRSVEVEAMFGVGGGGGGGSTAVNGSTHSANGFGGGSGGGGGGGTMAGVGPGGEGGEVGGPLGALLAGMKAWMFRFIQRHGFWGILLLASYPNAAFDLCGICCGHFLMPFWHFFGATLIGKGFIKVSGMGRGGGGEGVSVYVGWGKGMGGRV